ncbi:MAG: porin [Armatimonadota bacterium]
MTRLVVCFALAAMLLPICAAVAQEGLEEQCWYDRMCISGYFRVRYMDTDSASESDQFDLRDLYLTVQGDIDKRSRGIITLSRVGPGDPNIDLYNLFVDYKIDDQYRVQIGQVPTWFGLEAWEGSSVRLAFERAKILEAGTGFFWAGAPDRGVWFRRMPSPDNPYEPMVILGVSNGQFRADDKNDDKNFDLHLKWQQPWGLCGLSFLDGTYVDAADTETDRSAWDAYVRVVPNSLAGPVGLQFEFVDGELLGADRDGWYGQAIYDLGNTKDTAYLRYEEFNADVNPANSASFEGWTLGFSHRVYDSSRITVEYRDGDWERTGTVDGASGDASEDWFGVQWQYGFQ